MLPVAEGLPDAARQLLTTPDAPIVLVDKNYVPELCDDIAPGLNEVGVMLPANPVSYTHLDVYKRQKLRWIHILSYDQMVSRKINNQTTRCANSIFYTRCV